MTIRATMYLCKVLINCIVPTTAIFLLLSKLRFNVSMRCLGST